MNEDTDDETHAPEPAPKKRSWPQLDTDDDAPAPEPALKAAAHIAARMKGQVLASKNARNDALETCTIAHPKIPYGRGPRPSWLKRTYEEPAPKTPSEDEEEPQSFFELSTNSPSHEPMSPSGRLP